MASYIERGESLFIPFRNRKSISDSQLKPRMYKSVQNFEKTFPKHNYGTQNIELVEYAEVKHGKWERNERNIRKMKEFHEKGIGLAMHEQSIFWTCSECGMWGHSIHRYCSRCGAKMDGSDTE